MAVLENPINILLISAIVIALSQTNPGVYCLQYKSFENTVGKGEIASNFSFFHSVFCPLR